MPSSVSKTNRTHLSGDSPQLPLAEWGEALSKTDEIELSVVLQEIPEIWERQRELAWLFSETPDEKLARLVEEILSLDEKIPPCPRCGSKLLGPQEPPCCLRCGLEAHQTNEYGEPDFGFTANPDGWGEPKRNAPRLGRSETCSLCGFVSGPTTTPCVEPNCPDVVKGLRK